MITATIEQRGDDPRVIILEDEKLILKAYLSPDRTKIRIILPELTGYGQVCHFVEDTRVRFIEITRKAPAKYLRII